MAYGFVYVLRNDCMPGVFKIGYTDRAPMQRCEELSRSTGVPCNFELVCYGELDDAQEVESDYHGEYQEFRLNKGREFFKLDFQRLKYLVEDIDMRAVNFVRCYGYYVEERSNEEKYDWLALRWYVRQSLDDIEWLPHVWDEGAEGVL